MSYGGEPGRGWRRRSKQEPEDVLGVERAKLRQARSWTGERVRWSNGAQPMWSYVVSLWRTLTFAEANVGVRHGVLTHWGAVGRLRLAAASRRAR